jgi:DNA-binding NtrC family response regulator
VKPYLNVDVPLPGLEDRSVLVVDDSASLCKLMMNILEASGFRVVSADNGDSAMRLLQTRTFDLLITDVVMPGTLNGCELIHKARDLNPAMAVILTTGNVGDNAIFEMFEAGDPPPLLRKPFRMRELLETVRDAFTQQALSEN